MSNGITTGWQTLFQKQTEIVNLKRREAILLEQIENGEKQIQTLKEQVEALLDEREMYSSKSFWDDGL